jgi:hypothetical protein
MMARPPLLIIFPQTLQTTGFYLQLLENVAGWLWLNPQADQKQGSLEIF